MKTKLLFLLTLFVSVLNAQNLLWNYPLDNGNLNDTENSNNFNQNGNNLTITSNRFNASNKAITLNGDYLVSASGVSNTNMPRYTISFWVKTSTNDPNDRIIIDQLVNSGYRISLINGSLKILGRYEFQGQGVPNPQIFGNLNYTTSSIADGNWHHVALSVFTQYAMSGGIVNYYARIYLDGSLIEDHNHSFNSSNVYSVFRAINTNAEMVVGNNQNTNATFSYEDSIDDIQFYDTNLSAAQILDIYNERLAQTIYVNHTATGNNDGSTWVDAFTSLKDATDYATVSGDEIWVAQGTYTPHTSDNTISFALREGVKLYGGFNGTETLLSERNWIANETILSGDLNNDDSSVIAYGESSRNENSYRVIIVEGNNTVIDGITISGGNGIHSSNVNYQRGAAIYKASTVTSIDLKNCTIKNNIASYATGLYAEFNTNAQVNISKCIFENNLGRHSVAYFIRSNGNTTNVSIDNTLFTNNVVENLSSNDAYSGSAGQLSVNNVSAILNATISNCTLADNVENGTNSGLVSPGVIVTARYNGTINTNIHNTIFWDNSRLSGISQANSLGRMNATNFSNTLNFYNSLVPEANSGWIDTYATTVNQNNNVFNSNPQWLTNTGNFRYRLTINSPGYNTGNNALVVNESEGDLAGQVRIAEGTVEMGAFEAESQPLSNEYFLPNNTITLYPNPVINELHINSNKEIDSFEVYNISGRKIMQTKAATIPMNNHSAGLYIVRIKTINGKTITKKFIKK